MISMQYYLTLKDLSLIHGFSHQIEKLSIKATLTQIMYGTSNQAAVLDIS